MDANMQQHKVEGYVAPESTLSQDAPKLSGGLPLIGHTVEFARDAIGLLFRARRECGDVAEFQVAHKKMILLTGPEANEAFFRAPDSQLSPAAAYKMMVPIFGKDVAYDAPPARMAEQLGLLMPALRDKRMRGYSAVIAEEVRRSISTWGDSGELDLVEYCKVLTNFTSSGCLLGPEFRNEMTEEFASVYHDLERGITPASYISPHLPLPSFRKRDKARARLVEMIGEIIANRKREGKVGTELLQTLIDARYKDGSKPSDHEITGILLAVIFGGHHTSSVTTAWTLLELLRHPNYMKRVRDQLSDVYAGCGRDEVSFQSLREIPLVENAVKEALRLHPPLFILLRGVMEDFYHGGYRMPKGTFVAVSPHITHRIPSVFPCPDAFDPDRFGPGREEDKQPFAYISFGGGRHRCMGMAFALLQIKTIFSILLRNYEFEWQGDPIAADFQGLVVGPKQPCRVRYKKIK
jgi:sterol 14alpha-demethylase